MVGCTNLLDQLAEVRASPRATGALGSFGEAVAEVFLAEVLGHAVVADEASRGKPQGIDLVTYDAEHDRIVVVEVKTTGLESTLGPKLAKTTTTQQMSDRWITGGSASPSGVSRIAEVGLENVRGEDIGDAVTRMVAHVNVATGTVSLHDMDGDRVEREATVTVDLDDLVRFSDALRDRS
jgi:hypothetical protein